jgi:DNA-binding NtrC family response regulator
MNAYAADDGSRRPLRICLGEMAPSGLGALLESMAVELLGYRQREQALLYVDFVGARPAGVNVLSIDMTGGTGTQAARQGAALVTDSVKAAACLIVSTALGLKHPLLTSDAEMFTVARSALSVGRQLMPVLLAGEVGTGRHILARLIHAASGRPGAFVEANCAVVVEEDVLRVASRASGGTALWDEVAELSTGARVALLGLIARPGACDGARHILTTNRSHVETARSGDLSRELSSQLDVFTLKVPALRERSEDIALLARHFLRLANPRRHITAGALRLFSSYPWPGNVRELANLMERLAVVPLLSSASVIDVADVRRHIGFAELAADAPRWKAEREEARRALVIRALADAGGSRERAARLLGINVRTLQYHIKKAGLQKRYNLGSHGSHDKTPWPVGRNGEAAGL